MKWVSSYRDRHGKMRYRFRRTGYPSANFASHPGSAQFEAEYQAFVKGEKPRAPTPEEPLPIISLIKQLWRFEDRGPAVYFVEAENGLIKIGFSRSIRERFKKLHTASPGQLNLLGLWPAGQPIERELHRRFASQRVTGEWFKPSPELRALAAGSDREQILTSKV
jgi:hypothetical protein